MAFLSRNALAVIKLAAAVLLFPAVYAFSAAFISELNTARGAFAFYFWAGAATFAIFYIFVYQPEMIYLYGQKKISQLLGFSSRLSELAYYGLPAYTLVLFVLYAILVSFFGAKGIGGYFMLLVGFSSAMHLVLTAKSLNAAKGDFLKAGYLFGIILAYLATLLLLGFCFSLMLKGFSFVDFLGGSWRESLKIFGALF